MKILLIEDSPSDVYLIREKLRQSRIPELDLETVDRLSRGLERLSEETCDAVLLDLGLPDSQGLDSLSKLVEAAPGMPVIVLTGLADEELAYQAVQKGAQDYLNKNYLTGEILGRVIRYAVGRKQIESELRAEKNRARQYLDVAGVMIVAIDADQKVTLINKTGCRMLGYAEDEIIGRNWFDNFIPPVNVEEIKGVFNRLIMGDTELAGNFINTVLCRNGEEKIISWHNVLLTDENGHITGTLSSGEDITRRKKAEEALVKSEERLRLITGQVTDIIWSADLNFRFNFVTPSVERILGYTAEEFKSLSMNQVLTPESLNMAAGILTERAKSTRREPQILILEHICKDGSKKWGEVSIIRQVDAEGNFIGLIGVSRDISDRLKAEEERKLLEMQLQTAQKMEAIGTLAGGIAHDFNNILSAVIGYSELTLDEVEPGSVIHENVSEVLKAGKRARDLVRQILLFSRRAEKQRAPINIVPLLKEILKLLRASLPATIEISTNVESDNIVVMADPTEIYQMLMNICSNAGQAMKNDGGRLEISLSESGLDPELALKHPEIKPASFLRLTISDTGAGMTPEVMERMYDPFFTTKAPGEGTGMGLSVVHGLVQDLGGAIKVHSEPDRGTSFQIYIPLSEKQESETAVFEGAIPGGSERIMLVDDEHSVLQFTRQMLERLGYKVDCFAGPEEALDTFRQNPGRFDLLMTDITMPGMTGNVLAREILRLRPDLPVIVCTGYSEQSLEFQGKDAGIRGVLMKPLFMRSTAETIRRALDENRPPGATDGGTAI